MNLVWHIVRRDLRHHRVAYLVWVGLLLAKVAICARVVSLDGGNADWIEQMQAGYGVATAIAWLTGFLLAASIALDDELVGSGMFWATRPISWLSLLAAKIVGLGIFIVVVPVLLWVPWWLYCGDSLRGLWTNATEVLMAQGIAAALAMLAAALTGKSDRFLLLLLAAAVALVVLGLIGAGVSPLRLQTPEAVLRMRFLVGGALLFGTTVGVIWHQYRTRRTLASCLIAVGGFGLGILAAKAWPWAVTNPWKGVPSGDAGTEAVQVELVSVARASPAKMPKNLGYEWLTVTFRVRQVPEELHLSHGRAQVTLRWPDGDRFASEVGLLSGGRLSISRAKLGIGPTPTQTDPETQEYHRQLIETARTSAGNLTKVGAPADSFIELKGELILPRELADRIERNPPEYSADVRLTLARPQVRLEVPLEVGARGAGDGIRVQVVAEESELPKDTRREKSQFTVVSFKSRQEPILYVAMQRGTGAREERIHRESGTNLFHRLAPFALQVISFESPSVRRGGTWVPAPGSDGPLALAVVSCDSDRLQAQRQCLLPGSPK